MVALNQAHLGYNYLGTSIETCTAKAMPGRVDLGLLDPDGATEGDTCTFHPGHAEACFVMRPWFLQADGQMRSALSLFIRSPSCGGR